MQDQLRLCKRCDTLKPESEFALRSSATKGLVLRTWCKECDVVVKPAYSAENARVKKMRQRYGLTIEQFQQMGEEQQWLCYLCDTDISEKPFIDHNHDNGRVRKLLCFHCNLALGHFKDSTAVMERAITYVQEYA